MRKYIQDLTDYLITKHRFDEMREHFKGSDDFVRSIQLSIEHADVEKMNGATLGKILCSFEIDDVSASKRELFDGVHFFGDCRDTLIELVARCLAFVIRDRLDPDRHPSIPAYHKAGR